MSWRDDMVTAALCGWVVTGMVEDAWAHQLQLRDGIAWPAELWTGSIVFASLSGLALSLLMAPLPQPVAQGHPR